MYLDDIPLRLELVTDRVTIDEHKMVAFAEEYDPLPVHTDAEYAKTTRLKRLLAPGVMTFMEVWKKFVEQDLFGEELVAGKSTKIEWFLPVFAGDVLYGRAAVTGIERRNAYNGLVELTMDVYNQDEKCVLQSVIESIVAYRPQKQ